MIGKTPGGLAEIIICTALLVGCADNGAGPAGPGADDVGEEYLFSAQFLYAFFIFQDRLPDNPFVFPSPAQLYQSVNEPFTVYLPPPQAEAFLDDLDTESAGIGIIVDSVGPGFVITEVFEPSPASEAGLQEGDTLIEVGQRSLEDVSFVELAMLLRGQAGERKDITVKRGARLLDITVFIDEFLAPSVFVDSLDSALAYIRISSFFSRTALQKGSAAELSQALARTDFAAATIIDLRDNPGGELSQALAVTDQFLPASAPIIAVTQREFDPRTATAITNDTVFRATEGGRGINRSFVALVNENTASAAELLVAALKTNRPDIPIVGQTTFGKARGQTITLTPDSGLARVTFALLEPVDGPSYDLAGIEPDVAVMRGVEPLRAAIDRARETLAKRVAVGSDAINRIDCMRAMYPRPACGPATLVWTRMDGDALSGALGARGARSR